MCSSDLGGIKIVNYKKYRERCISTSTERVRKHRERKHDETGVTFRNDGNGYSNEKEKEKEKEKELRIKESVNVNADTQWS